MSPAKKHYLQLDKETLAIIFGIKKFHDYLQVLLSIWIVNRFILVWCIKTKTSNGLGTTEKMSIDFGGL